MRLRKSAFWLAVVVSGCSLDYSQVSVADEMIDTIPDSVLEDFTYTIVRGGAPAYLLEADLAKFFQEREETHLEGLVFRELNKEGALVTEGTADEAIYFTATENAELEGSLSFFSAIEEATIKSDYLYWDAENKLLVGRADGEVSIRSESGSGLDGVGFEADIRRRFVDFAGNVSGTFVPEENE